MTISINHRIFKAEEGIAQGSPTSPLIFILTLDKMNQKIKEKLPEAEIISYYDDMTILSKENIKIKHIIKFGKEFNLRINMNKTTTTGFKIRGLKKLRVFKILGIYMDNNAKILRTKPIEKKMKAMTLKIKRRIKNP